MKRIVLDASAVMAFFRGRPGSERVKELFAGSESSRQLLMSAVNWGEVYYSIWRDRGREDAERALAHMARLRIEVVPVDAALAKLAGELKVRFQVSYADAFAAALGILRKASVLTSDPDFLRVKNQVKVSFIS